METKEISLITNCLACGSGRLFTYLDLGDQPPPNDFRDSATQDQKKFPLVTRVCERCFHSQVGHSVAPQILFNNSYPYRTGVSRTLVEYYDRFAKEVSSYADSGSRKPKIIDIGCNDGTLLNGFRKAIGKSAFLIGVDMSHCQGVESVADIFFMAEWGEDFIENTKSLWHAVDIITGTNVFAHTPNPKCFLIACRKALTMDGVIVLEFPHCGSMIRDCLFDTIYHEHYSYFHCRSFIELLRGTGLRVEHAVLNDRIHGGSIRFCLRRCTQGKEVDLSISSCVSSRNIMDAERKQGLYDIETYKQMSQRLRDLEFKFNLAVGKAVSKHNITPVVFGASGKSTVMLNKFGLPVSYIVDETPAKNGKFSPGRSIPIKGIKEFKEDDVNRPIIIASWNCMQESIEKIAMARHGKDDAILTYLPIVSSRNSNDAASDSDWYLDKH